MPHKRFCEDGLLHPLQRQWRLREGEQQAPQVMCYTRTSSCPSLQIAESSLCRMQPMRAYKSTSKTLLVAMEY